MIHERKATDISAAVKQLSEKCQVFVVNRSVCTAWGIVKRGEHHGAKLPEMSRSFLLPLPYILNKEKMWILGAIKQAKKKKNWNPECWTQIDWHRQIQVVVVVVFFLKCGHVSFSL